MHEWGSVPSRDISFHHYFHTDPEVQSDPFSKGFKEVKRVGGVEMYLYSSIFAKHHTGFIGKQGKNFNLIFNSSLNT
jgi:hypothetical protein